MVREVVEVCCEVSIGEREWAGGTCLYFEKRKAKSEKQNLEIGPFSVSTSNLQLPTKTNRGRKAVAPKRRGWELPEQLRLGIFRAQWASHPSLEKSSASTEQLAVRLPTVGCCGCCPTVLNSIVLPRTRLPAHQNVSPWLCIATKKDTKRQRTRNPLEYKVPVPCSQLWDDLTQWNTRHTMTSAYEQGQTRMNRLGWVSGPRHDASGRTE